MLRAELHRQGVPAVICSVDDLRYDSTHRRLYSHDADGHRQPITVVPRRALLNDLLSRYGPDFIDHPLPRAWSAGACVMVNSFTSQLSTKKSALTLFADPRTSVLLSPQTAQQRRTRTWFLSGAATLLLLLVAAAAGMNYGPAVLAPSVAEPDPSVAVTKEQALEANAAQLHEAAIAALGLGQVPLAPEFAAHTMTAPRYPAGIGAADLLPRITRAGAILAGGLHPDIRAEYFRIGHMGATKQGDVLATVGAIEAGLAACGYEFDKGAGVAAAAAAY